MAARARSALARVSLRGALIALGVVLVAINVGAAIWDVRTARERTERLAERDVSNLTSLLSEQTASALEAVDLVLRDAVREGSAAKAAAAAPQLRDEIMHIPQVAAFLVLDARGRVIARTHDAPLIDTGVAERPYFTAHRDGLTQGLFVSEPYQAFTTGRWRFAMSRRLDTPDGRFGGILGYAEMLFEQTGDGSPLKRYARNVLAAANRARGLVDQILAYSRSQRGRRVPVDFVSVAAEALELIRGSLAPGMRLEGGLPATPLFVIGDPTQLHQIVMNLCTNAIQAMGEHGTLRVALEAADVGAERALAHGTLQPRPYVRLAVEDTGFGMDEMTIARIFEPFFTTKEVGKGTGLGLSLVYGIVIDSGGAVDVTSVVGRGSTFTIYLPRVDMAVALGDPGEAPLPRGHGEKVLVVDDEEPLVALTSEALLRLGYEPVGFSDSQAALAAFESAAGQFDAAITDEVMPRLAGTELAALLHRRRADMPIVLVSGYIGPMLAGRAHGAGVTQILKKPVQARELAMALARALRRAA